MAHLISLAGQKLKYLSILCLGIITELSYKKVTNTIHLKNKRSGIMEVFHVVIDKYIMLFF